jgi:hypothetical protein
MRVSPGHSISERWLEEQAPDLYARWWDAPSLGARDQVARDIEKRLEDLEAAESWEKMALRHRVETPPSPPSGRVASYEAQAAQLGATPFADPGRTAAHRRHQAVGDALRDELAAASAGAERDQLARRLDAADLVADRPFIEAVSQITVDGLAVAALNAGAEEHLGQAATERIQAEMIAEDPHAALRADVLLAAEAAGHDLAKLREFAGRGQVALAEVAPALLPASDFYARHATAIEARLDREIAAGGFADLPSYLASWPSEGPVTGSLHDTEQAIVEHVVGALITESDASGRDLRDAQRMRQ